MSKSIILPIITTIAIAIQILFGVQIPEEVINETATVVANAIAIGITLFGVFKTHNKDKK